MEQKRLASRKGRRVEIKVREALPLPQRGRAQSPLSIFLFQILPSGVFEDLPLIQQKIVQMKMNFDYPCSDWGVHHREYSPEGSGLRSNDVLLSNFSVSSGS